MSDYQIYSGAIHIHTKCSDGSGDLEEIVSSARSTGLDYIIITDHNTLCYYKQGKEGWYGNLLVLIGEEVTHRKGHCLALNVSRSVAINNGNPLKYLKDIQRQGGLSFIAHPHLKRKRMFRIKNCTWENWHLNTFNGIEIWSYMTDWAQHLSLRNFISHCKEPDNFISGPFRESLKKWDELSQQRRVVGIGGVDAHAKVLLPFGLKKIFPYEKLFRTVQTYILSEPLPQDNFAQAKKILYQALAEGHCFIANVNIGDARGFRFYAKMPDGGLLQQGDEAEFKPGCQLYAETPTAAVCRLLCNGNLILEQKTQYLIFTPDQPGVYRIEIFLDNNPWIFSNPIYLRETSVH